MKDFQNQREKLLKEAADCELISNLASDGEKREVFSKLAQTYREIASRLAEEMEKRQPGPSQQLPTGVR
jgi:hypothetical protein